MYTVQVSPPPVKGWLRTAQQSTVICEPFSLKPKRNYMIYGEERPQARCEAGICQCGDLDKAHADNGKSSPTDGPLIAIHQFYRASAEVLCSWQFEIDYSQVFGASTLISIVISISQLQKIQNRNNFHCKKKLC